jgi:fumarate reductase subunit D
MRKRFNSIGLYGFSVFVSRFLLRLLILDGVVTLHEMIHEMHRKKLNRVILKIDFEKAYDKWSFLRQTLRMKGFSKE